MNTKIPMHFCANYLINPTNPITVNLIGAGGSGSQMLTELARISHSLTALGHAGLQVFLYDDDIITEANMGRQMFAPCEVRLKKSDALISRINRFYGFGWKAVTTRYEPQMRQRLPDQGRANITISCVDTVKARFGISEILKQLAEEERHSRNRPFYWMDLGNASDTGQVLLATVCTEKQPNSERYQPVAHLPMVTDEYREMLEAQVDNNEPSCSLAEALEKQDLFVNSTLANLAASLLWKLLRSGMTDKRGYFMNLSEGRVNPVLVV